MYSGLQDLKNKYKVKIPSIIELSLMLLKSYVNTQTHAHTEAHTHTHHTQMNFLVERQTLGLRSRCFLQT